MESRSSEISVVRHTLVGIEGNIDRLLLHPRAKTIIASVRGSPDVQIWDMNAKHGKADVVKVQKSSISCVSFLLPKLALDEQGGLLVSSGVEEPCPVSVHPLIPFFEGSRTVRLHTSQIMALGFYNSDVILAGLKNGNIQMTFRGSKDKKPKLLRSLSSGEGSVLSVQALKSENSLMSTTQSGKLEVWDLVKGKVKSSQSINLFPQLNAVPLSKHPNGSPRLTTSYPGHIERLEHLSLRHSGEPHASGLRGMPHAVQAKRGTAS